MIFACQTMAPMLREVNIITSHSDNIKNEINVWQSLSTWLIKIATDEKVTTNKKNIIYHRSSFSFLLTTPLQLFAIQKLPNLP